MIEDDPPCDTSEESVEPAPVLEAAVAHGNVHPFPPIPAHLDKSGHGVSLPRRPRLLRGSETTTGSPPERGRPAVADPPSRAEKIKLLAGYLNTVASGLMVTGVVGPIANYLYGTTSTTSRSPWGLVGEIVALIMSSVCVHLLSRKVLEGPDR